MCVWLAKAYTDGLASIFRSGNAAADNDADAADEHADDAALAERTTTGLGDYAIHQVLC